MVHGGLLPANQKSLAKSRPNPPNLAQNEPARLGRFRLDETVKLEEILQESAEMGRIRQGYLGFYEKIPFAVFPAGRRTFPAGFVSRIDEAAFSSTAIAAIASMIGNERFVLIVTRRVSERLSRISLAEASGYESSGRAATTVLPLTRHKKTSFPDFQTHQIIPILLGCPGNTDLTPGGNRN